MEIIKKQNALVLQGQGSLGAYEVGVLKEFERIVKEYTSGGLPIFDIIIGTSMGAINAAILTSFYIKNRTWKDAYYKVEEFWQYLASKAESFYDYVPWFKESFDILHYFNSNVATGEEALRHYSAKDFALRGIANIFYPKVPLFDRKFLDSQNVLYRYDNEPLKNSIARFVNFPIATELDKGEPRLLLVATDVQHGLPVVFDSYPKDDGSRKTNYGREDYNPKEGKLAQEYTISYIDGINIEHVIASATTPLFFDYTIIKAKKTKTEEESPRYLWDSSVLSNSLLRELVRQHKRFWKEKAGNDRYSITDDSAKKQGIPHLNIMIINPWIQTEDVPFDRDGMIDRKNDITMVNKLPYDIEVSLLMTDYSHLIKNLVDFIKSKGVNESEINSILDRKLDSSVFTEIPKCYRDILMESFYINDIFYIQRKGAYQELTAFEDLRYHKSNIFERIQEGSERIRNIVNEKLKEGTKGLAFITWQQEAWAKKDEDCITKIYDR